MEKYDISRAVKALKKGGLIVVPTETVFGIVGNAFNEKTYHKLNRIKNRNEYKKYTLFIRNSELIDNYAYVDDVAKAIIGNMMPGPLTIILESKDLPEYLISKDGTVGFRIPMNTKVKKILSGVEFPLISTSANEAGGDIIDSVEGIKKVFKGEISVYLKGKSGGGIPSTVVKTGDEIDILRRGPYKVADFVKYGLKIGIKKRLRILFVCYANIVRSPIAEYYFNKNCDCDVRSAGVNAKPGKFPTKEAIEASKSLGVDITHHPSEKLTERDLNWADIIFATDNMVRANIYDYYGYGAKVFLISDFSKNMKGELIPDPYKFELNAYYKMIKSLKYHLEELIEWINKNIVILSV